MLALIPARAGSKGVPNKNIRPLSGRPLVSHTISAASESMYIDRIVVSTDCEHIADVCRSNGAEVPFLRPKKLASDTSTSVEVVKHALDHIEGFNIVVLLQPTSPLRSGEDIDRCLELMIAANEQSCASVTASSKHPAWSYTLENGSLRPFLGKELTATRRQDLSEVVNLNGAIFATTIANFMQKSVLVSGSTVAYVMPEERSIDIDTEFDFHLASLLTSAKSP